MSKPNLFWIPYPHPTCLRFWPHNVCTCTLSWLHLRNQSYNQHDWFHAGQISPSFENKVSLWYLIKYPLVTKSIITHSGVGHSDPLLPTFFSPPTIKFWGFSLANMPLKAGQSKRSNSNYWTLSLARNLSRAYRVGG